MFQQDDGARDHPQQLAGAADEAVGDALSRREPDEHRDTGPNPLRGSDAAGDEEQQRVGDHRQRIDRKSHWASTSAWRCTATVANAREKPTRSLSSCAFTGSPPTVVT